MLRIGTRGFTLLEVMITAAVLSLGVVFIYEAFFISLNTYNYCTNYLGVANWMNEKIWQAQDSLTHLGTWAYDREGTLVYNNRDFKWNLTYSPVQETQDLYKIDLLISWQEGSSKKSLTRSAYALYYKEK
jgi:prepilin-type N-terminal cleavage/methylation domain-containing protein